MNYINTPSMPGWTYWMKRYGTNHRSLRGALKLLRLEISLVWPTIFFRRPDDIQEVPLKLRHVCYGRLKVVDGHGELAQLLLVLCDPS